MGIGTPIPYSWPMWVADLCMPQMQGGGLRVNNVKIDDEGYVMTEADLIDGRLVLLSTGKKNKLLLRVE